MIRAQQQGTHRVLLVCQTTKTWCGGRSGSGVSDEQALMWG